MKSFEYTIKDELGIHARPAGLLVKAAKAFKPATTITLHKGEKSSDVTKLMSLMSLAVKCGDTVTITAEGGDEEAAAAAIEKFLQENL
ncbi:MAG: HPr family phosphocarrier protein [Blautia sp.]|nr:HPr family phosphocarrier protein [Blautia sp.]